MRVLSPFLLRERHLMKIWNTKDEWAQVRSSAVVGGSKAQATNVLEMAIQDILALHAEVARLGGAKLEKRRTDQNITFRR
jgi:hypothetical protein